MVPLADVLTTVTRQAVGTLSGSSGSGRLDRMTGLPPFVPVDRAPPPVATSPASQLACVDSEKLVEMVLRAADGRTEVRLGEIPGTRRLDAGGPTRQTRCPAREASWVDVVSRGSSSRAGC